MKSVMDTVGTGPNESHDIGRAYTKQLSNVGLLQIFLIFSAIVTYCYFDLPQWAARIAELFTRNFYLQLSFCWLPVWIIYTACSLPSSCWKFHLDRKFGLSRANFRTTILDFLKAKAILLIFGSALLEIEFASHILSRSYGWILAGVLCSILFFVIDRSLPFLLSLFYRVVPLSNDSLRERLARLSCSANIRIAAIFEWHISGRTRQANALVSGFGTGRRIFLTDTLLNELSPDEIEAIVAHELGHCALHHVVKRMLFQCAILCGIFWVINFAVVNGLVWLGTERLGWNDLNLVPGTLVIFVFGQFYGKFFMAALSRRQERAADLYSWKLTGGTAPFISAMRKLQELNLIVFDKHTQWNRSHPATAERIATAQQHEIKHLASIGVTQDSHNPIASVSIE